MVRMVTKGVMAGLLGASLLLGPGAAEAKQGGKWWSPGGRGNGHRIERSQPRRFSRQWRNWGDRRVYRDVITIRASRGPRYRAWRTYCPPEYIYSRRVIRVRPVRFVVSAVIGGGSFYGGYHDDDLYGCNFCDARFGSYDAYHSHVGSCGRRPHGYRVECNDWDEPGQWDDRGWRDDDERSYERERVRERERVSVYRRDDGRYGDQDRYGAHDRYDDRDRAYDRDDCDDDRNDDDDCDR